MAVARAAGARCAPRPAASSGSAAVVSRPGANREWLVGWRGRAARLLQRQRCKRRASMDLSRVRGAPQVVPAGDFWLTPMTPAPAYAELHCLSNFSFLRGASHAEELVMQAKELGYEALAITDECSLAGVVRAHGAVKKVGGIKLLIGAEL